jgi:hypothetical protein
VLQIRNLRKNTDFIHTMIDRSVQENDHEKLNELKGEIFHLKNEIEHLCAKHQGTAADLGTPSYRQYLWLRFLSTSNHLAVHLQGFKEFIQVITDEKINEVGNLANFQLKIDFSGYLYQRKTSHQVTRLLINEGFIHAPVSVKSQLIQAAFARRKTKSISKLKAYTNSEGFLRITELIAGDPIANNLICKGKNVDLSLLFHSLNKRYFNESLKPPRLMWSSARAKRRLGYFHPEIQTIAINQKLDGASIPRLLIEYILYHEMLHQYFGIEHRDGRRYAHTPTFHRAEKRFKGYQEAENLIKLLQ